MCEDRERRQPSTKARKREFKDLEAGPILNCCLSKPYRSRESCIYWKHCVSIIGSAGNDILGKLFLLTPLTCLFFSSRGSPQPTL